MLLAANNVINMHCNHQAASKCESLPTVIKNHKLFLLMKYRYFDPIININDITKAIT